LWRLPRLPLNNATGVPTLFGRRCRVLSRFFHSLLTQVTKLTGQLCHFWQTRPLITLVLFFVLTQTVDTRDYDKKYPVKDKNELIVRHWTYS